MLCIVTQKEIKVDIQSYCTKPMLCIVTMTLKGDYPEMRPKLCYRDYETNVIIQYATQKEMYRDYDPQSSYSTKPMLCIVTDPQSSYPICDQCYVS